MDDAIDDTAARRAQPALEGPRVGASTVRSDRGSDEVTAIAVEAPDAASAQAPAINPTQGVRLASLGRGVSSADVDEKSRQVVVRRSGRVIERFAHGHELAEYAADRELSNGDLVILLKLHAVRDAGSVVIAQTKSSIAQDPELGDAELANSPAARSEKARRRAEEHEPTRNSIEPQLERDIADAEPNASVNTRSTIKEALKVIAPDGLSADAAERLALFARLKRAELRAAGWRGTDDPFSRLLIEMEQLAPAERDTTVSRREGQAPDPVVPATNLASDEQARDRKPAKAGPDVRDDARDEQNDKVFVPSAALTRRFLHADNTYYFRDERSTVAFVDRGAKLSTEPDFPDVARSMVELAQAKGWTKLDLNGTDEFKREAWLEASMRGLDTKGFDVREVDRARLAEIRAERKSERSGANSIEAAGREQDRAPADERRLTPQQTTAVEALKAILKERGDSDKQIAAAAALATERFQNNRVYVGAVLEHGSAPYEFDNSKARNYFVRLDTAQGEKVVWGVDLERAVEQGEVVKGDKVAIAYQGQQQVTVMVKDRDPAGKVTGEREVVTNRNTWAAEKVETLRADALARLNGAADRTSRQPVVRIHDRNAPRQRQPQPQAHRSRSQQRDR